jgi:NADH-quinone oxidoreductase subunit J
MTDILIWIFSILAVFAAFLLLFTRSVLYGAYSLVLCLLSLAALYVLLQAEFIGITQVMIYVGGVIVLLLFSVMLTHKIKGKPLLTSHSNKFTAFLVILGFMSVITVLAYHVKISSPELTLRPDIIKQTGIYLMTDYLLPMEIIAILLLIVLIGAASVARELINKGGSDG